MRVAILTVKIPFAEGGAEYHARGLRQALTAAGHEADVLEIPFKWYPPERILDAMLACRLFDISESEGRVVERAIGLRFPAYYVPHPRKVIWLLHQHRPAYDLWDHELGSDIIHTPAGAVVRDSIRHADRQFLAEARAIFANSKNVGRRLQTFCGIPSAPLYHPPPFQHQVPARKTENYLFFPSRLSPPKRQVLAIEALARTRCPVRLAIAGAPSAPGYEKTLEQKARSLGVQNRVEWLGRITDEEKAVRYAACAGVLFPPFDEDYGYVTLEAMLAAKPVITCKDSGGPLEFVVDAETGIVAEPTAEAVARAMDTLWSDPKKVAAMGTAGRDRYAAMGISWSNVVRTLLEA